MSPVLPRAAPVHASAPLTASQADAQLEDQMRRAQMRRGQSVDAIVRAGDAARAAPELAQFAFVHDSVMCPLMSFMSSSWYHGAIGWAESEARLSGCVAKHVRRRADVCQACGGHVSGPEQHVPGRRIHARHQVCAATGQCPLTCAQPERRAEPDADHAPGDGIPPRRQQRV